MEKVHTLPPNALPPHWRQFERYVPGRHTDGVLETALIYGGDIPEQIPMYPEDRAMTEGALAILRNHQEAAKQPLIELRTPAGIPGKREVARYLQQEGATLPALIVAATNLEGRPHDHSKPVRGIIKATHRIGSVVVPDALRDTRRTAEYSLRSLTNALIKERYEKSKYNRYSADEGLKDHRRNDDVSAAPFIWAMAAERVAARDNRREELGGMRFPQLAGAIGLAYEASYKMVSEAARADYPPELKALYDEVRRIHFGRERLAILKERELSDAIPQELSGRERRRQQAGARETAQRFAHRAGYAATQLAVDSLTDTVQAQEAAAEAKRLRDIEEKKRIARIKTDRQAHELHGSLEYNRVFYNDATYLGSQIAVSLQHKNGEAMADALMALTELRDAGSAEAGEQITKYVYDARDYLIKHLYRKRESIQKGYATPAEIIFINKLQISRLRDKPSYLAANQLRLDLADGALTHFGSRTHVPGPKVGGVDTVSIAQNRMNHPDRKALRVGYGYDVVSLGGQLRFVDDDHADLTGTILHRRKADLQRARDGADTRLLPLPLQHIIAENDRWAVENNLRSIA